MKRGWFGPKTFGWGAQPTGWQGWVVILLFVLVMMGSSLVPEHLRAWVQVAAVAAFLGVVVLTYRRSDAS
jgi:Ca2+/Na+ antiporter